MEVVGRGGRERDLAQEALEIGDRRVATRRGIERHVEWRAMALRHRVARGCDDGEQNLDMTQAIGMAPGLAGLEMYVGSTDTAIISAMTTHSPLASAIGCSWGWGPADASTLDPYFEKMATQGQSFFVASGDDSTWKKTGNAAAWPGDDAHIISVGGTDMTTNGAGGTSGRIDGIRRNQYTRPKTDKADVRLGKNFYFNVNKYGIDRPRLEFFAEVFNVANHQNITGVQNTAYNPNNPGDELFGVGLQFEFGAPVPPPPKVVEAPPPPPPSAPPPAPR